MSVVNNPDIKRIESMLDLVLAAMAETDGRSRNSLLERATTTPPPSGAFLNVNIPSPDLEAPPGYAGVPGIRGVKVTELGERVYSDEIIMREDPRGHRYFWIGGVYPTMYATPGSDCEAVMTQHVSVTPLSLDLTHRQVLPTLSDWATD